MLCLARKPGQRITIGKEIVIVVNSIEPTCVRLGIQAPRELEILRDDVICKEPKRREEKPCQK